ncbi:MAG: helix-turn-helix domain-containing protein, partial [Nitrospiria bacterium]
FDAFYKDYPKKKSPGDAEKAWNTIKPDRDLVLKIMAGLVAAKKSEDWKKENGQYIPYPARWLRAKGWEDEHQALNEIPEGEEWKYE